MACAASTDGDVAYWYTDGPDPGKWPIVLRDRNGARWEAYPMSLVELLLGIYTDTLGDRFAEAGYLTTPIRFEADPFPG
ncbi:hypothetical protein [Streptomyces odontomachi]|uniref:hypothetical protein n=1 Tax=Streptomyces odontomachi TaxID=2944940 RepID=UPI00210967E6|nr:hypothetical protein [Streptomyces sp. ODS25]